MTPDLQDVKDFLRVDGTYDEGVILSFIKSAKVELSKSGVKEVAFDHPDYPLYETAVKIVVARDYEDRGFSERDMRIINNIILKLKDFVPEEVVIDES